VRYRRWKISSRETCGAAIAYDDVLERVRASVALYLQMKPDAVAKAIRAFNTRSQAAEELVELDAKRTFGTRMNIIPRFDADSLPDSVVPLVTALSRH
jgi:hypothetical protein